jgi:hypothetical protein
MDYADREYDGGEPDGAYIGCSSSVAAVMNTFEHVRDWDADSYYELQIGQNLRDHGIEAKHSPSLRTEKLRRTGKYKYSLDDARIVGNDSLQETQNLQDIYMNFAEQIPSNAPCT